MIISLLLFKQGLKTQQFPHNGEWALPSMIVNDEVWQQEFRKGEKRSLLLIIFPLLYLHLHFLELMKQFPLLFSNQDGFELFSSGNKGYHQANKWSIHHIITKSPSLGKRNTT